jgi:guanosine-3',5'-bis(diphosphate) 3'-pyrophosphohydrolase
LSSYCAEMDNTETLRSLLDALLFAADRHKFDKTKGDEPYINHLIEVCTLLHNVAGINDPVILVAGAMHDILEKTTTKTDEIIAQFGYDVCSIVLELTTDQHLNETEKWTQQLNNVNSLSSKARVIKLADKISNTSAIITNPPKGWSIRRRITYLEWSEKIINALRGTNKNLELYFDRLMVHEKNA